MKRVFLILMVFSMVLLLGSCMTVGDMTPPNETETVQMLGEETHISETEEEGTSGQSFVELPDPEEDRKKTIKFVAAGDALIHSAIFWEAESIAATMPEYNGKYYFKGMYENIAEEIGSADIAFVNHEAPISKTYVSGYPNFNSPSESGDTLVDLGFNVVNIANNHMLDAEGRTNCYADTIEYWETKDVLQIGGYKNTNDYDTPRVLSVEGVKIAFLAYTYGTNGMTLNAASRNAGYVVPLINDSVLVKHISSAKQVADLVFVSIHWGNESVFSTTPEQKRLAKLMADNGADVIIGHHSHTVQPVEWIDGASGNKTLCIYSLGNMISSMLYPVNMVGGLMTFNIVKDGETISIEEPIYKPIVTHYEIKDLNKWDPDGYQVRTEFKVYYLDEYTDELAKKHGVHTKGYVDRAVFFKYVKDTISPEFLPEYLK